MDFSLPCENNFCCTCFYYHQFDGTDYCCLAPLEELYSINVPCGDVEEVLKSETTFTK